MQEIEIWFPDLRKLIIVRSGRDNWAPLGSEFWADYERSLKRLGVTYAQADEAVSIVSDIPNVFPSDYRGRLVEACKQVMARDAAKDQVLGRGRAEAERLSKDCPECGGAGSSDRYVHRDDLPGRPRGTRESRDCGSCELGRFYAISNRRETWDAAPALRYHPDLKHLHHPDDWDDATGKPRERSIPEVLARWWQRVRAGKAATSPAKGLAAHLADVGRSDPADAPEATPGPSAPPPDKSWRLDAGEPNPIPGRRTGKPPAHRDKPPF